MGAILTQPRFVRHQDLSAWDLRDRLRVNPRTGYVESRAGLTWEGVREYHTSDGVINVLRRKSQVESPGHMKTLRRLGTPPGHPSGDRDLSPATNSELFAGFTGDKIDIEACGAFSRPVADLTVTRADVFSQMMDAAQWGAYQAEYPQYAAGVSRPAGPARTGTSLGYNALWLSPTVEDEIIAETSEGYIGEWLGPDGKRYKFNAEHIVDPKCEIVAKLARDDGFNAESLGGQHFAINLEALAGRGGQQSELIRVVDSRLVGSDPRRGRVQSQVPRALLPAAMPDASAQETPDRAPTPDHTPEREDIKMTKQAIEIGVSDRGVRDLLNKRGIAIPATLKMTVDEIDAAKLLPAIEAIMGMLAEVSEALKMSETEKDGMAEELGEAKEQVEDMPDAKALEAKATELAAQLKAVEEDLAKAKASGAEAKKATDEASVSAVAALATANASIAALNKELEPVRAKDFADFQAQAVKFGLPEAQAQACVDTDTLKRAFVVHTFADDAYAKSEPATIDPLFDGAWKVHSQKPGTPVVDEKPKTKAPYKPGPGLRAVPTPKITADQKTPPTEHQPLSRKASIGAAIL